jgi:hypothetical protein
VPIVSGSFFADRFFRVSIAEYGRAQVGLPFFAAVDAGYAKSSLLGGYPSNGRWKPAFQARL